MNYGEVDCIADYSWRPNQHKLVIMNILFWNIHGCAITGHVAACAYENDADVICLAEHQSVDPKKLCASLGGNYSWICGPDDSRSKKVILFARNTVKHIMSGQLLEQRRYLVWSFECESVRYNLVALHMVDKRSERSSFARLHDAKRIMGDLRNRELQTHCTNSIIIGDFNADPFEPELIAKDSFYAVLFKDVIQKMPVRRRGDEEFKMMYNPVLHFLSEDTKCYGSFYWGQGFSDIYWHCYDQALVSASIVDCVKNLRYIRFVNHEALIPQIKPNDKISDHLPLLLTIEGE